MLRDLPAVHEVFDRLPRTWSRFPRAVVMAEIRRVLEKMRAEIETGRVNPVQMNDAAIDDRVQLALLALETPSQRHVINATGVVLHTNLGRAPLGAMTVLPGYTNLEYDLAAGSRGKRDVHAAALLERLLGVPAITVNNNAAAVFLALNELAAGGEVVISRGELIEIGDGFRIPDILARTGAVLREVGTTNRTQIADYRAAINDRTRLLLRVHPSNFRITGFTARAALHELVALGREHNIPVYEDLGSGCLVDLKPFGIDEPLVLDILKTGADLVSFSGDKLLGGPQAGILAGSPAVVSRLRRNPLYRALRLDKVMYLALETTLRNLLLERWECVPALAMLRQTAEQIRARAERLLQRMPKIPATIVPGESVIGGGATPEQTIPTWLIAIGCPDVVEAERQLRAGDPPVVARIEGGRLVLDLRTVFVAEEEQLIRAAASISGSALPG